MSTPFQDRTFFLAVLVVAWSALLSGFSFRLMNLGTAGLSEFTRMAHIHIAVYIGVCDLVTRKRLYTSCIWAAAFFLTVIITSGWLYFNPTWREFAAWMVG